MRKPPNAHGRPILVNGGEQQVMGALAKLLRESDGLTPTCQASHKCHKAQQMHWSKENLNRKRRGAYGVQCIFYLRRALGSSEDQQIETHAKTRSDVLLPLPLRQKSAKWVLRSACRFTALRLL